MVKVQVQFGRHEKQNAKCHLHFSKHSNVIFSESMLRFPGPDETQNEIILRLMHPMDIKSINKSFQL